MTLVSTAAAAPTTRPGLVVSPPAPASLSSGRPPALLHTDFRSLLRGEALAREPVAVASPPPCSAGSTRAPASAADRAAAASFTPGELLASAGAGPDGDPLDSFARHHASLAPPETLFAPPTPVAAIAPLERPFAQPAAETALQRTCASSLEHLLPALVRRVAWCGDGRRGTIRLELGAGELAGATLLVHADGGRVRVHLDLPAGVDAARWEERIRERLEKRRIPADAVEVA